MERHVHGVSGVVAEKVTKPLADPLMQSDRLVVLLTSGNEDKGKRATLAFSAACSAVAMGQDTQVFLVGDGSFWGYSGRTEGIQAASFPPLEDLFQSFLEFGGTVAMCSSCEGVCGLDEMRGAAQQRRPGVSVRGFATVVADLCGAASITF